MNRDTIIGFVLIAAVLIGFSWWNQPSAEQIEAARLQDSLQAVAQAEMAKKEAAALAAKQQGTAGDSVGSGSAATTANKTRWLATPLFVTLLVIETTDVAFAVDSIPAVFSVSRDPFIVLTSNIFAILGLRALYFALAAVAQYFKYLKYGLGVILIFVGIKMLLAMNEYINAIGEFFGLQLNMPHIEVPTPWSLAIIFGVLVLSMGASYLVTKQSSTT